MLVHRFTFYVCVFVCLFWGVFYHQELLTAYAAAPDAAAVIVAQQEWLDKAKHERETRTLRSGLMSGTMTVWLVVLLCFSVVDMGLFSWS